MYMWEDTDETGDVEPLILIKSLTVETASAPPVEVTSPPLLRGEPSIDPGNWNSPP